MNLSSSGSATSSEYGSDRGRPNISVKEAVRIAGNNNFMGLICSSQLLVRCVWSDLFPQGVLIR